MKYHLISYRIDLGSQTPIYDQEVYCGTVAEFLIHSFAIGGDYANKTILYAEEITESDYDELSQYLEE